MKIALLLPLLLLVAAALARPAEQEITEQEIAEQETLVPQEPQQVRSELEESSVRERRSPKDRGTITGGVHREPGVGTVVHAQGEGNIWKSKSGNSRLDAHGDWSKVVNGPGRGKPNYNVGIKFTGRF